MGDVEAAAVRQEERGPGLHGGHGPRDDVDGVAAAGLEERGQEGAVVDLMVAGDLDAAAEGGAQRRHEAAALAGAAPCRREAERVLVGEEVVEGGPVRRIEGDGHGARRVVADRVAGGGLEFGREGRPQGGALEEQRRECGLAELCLGHRRQHPGRNPRGAVVPGPRGHERHMMTVS